MLVSEKIKDYRKKTGITAMEFGQLIDAKQATVSRYESGSIRSIPYDKLKKIGEVLHCSVEELTNGDPAYFYHINCDNQHNEKNCNENKQCRIVSDPDLICLIDWYESLSTDQRAFVRKITDGNSHSELLIIKASS